MTNEELIQKIRTEIERLMDEYKPTVGGIDETTGAHIALAKLLLSLSTLEESEKPNQEGLEEEAVSYCFDNGLNLSPRTATDFARHFYELGCRRTAEKYDEIEYNRQREEESVPKDLDEAAEEYAPDIPSYSAQGISLYIPPESHQDLRDAFIAGAKWQAEKEKEYSPWLSIQGLKDAALEFGEQAKAYEIGGQSFSEDMMVAFTRGAEWQKEQMMKEAYDGEFFYNPYPGIALDDCKDYDFKDGDEVRIIIV